MIIFDLDNCLADCEHRKHFVDCFNYDQSDKGYVQKRCCDCPFPHQNDPWIHKNTGEKWKPDWEAFYEACDMDTAIEPVCEIWNDQTSLAAMHSHQVWTGRCESVKDKTLSWLQHHLLCFDPSQLKMRPIGASTPDHEIKERWLIDHITYSELTKTGPGAMDGFTYKYNEPIDFVFDADPKSIAMWRRSGIFVFNCCQHDGEF